MSKIIAIDFDETITDHSPYPIMGTIRLEAITYIKQLHDLGYILILWTARSGVYLQEAEKALETVGILDCFDYINEGPQPDISRKIEADFFIDDRSMMEDINWSKIYNYIIDNFPVKEEDD